MSRRAPVRMGVLNLLVLVIALCLAVLAALALTTAQAGRTLSERQADELAQVQAAEAAGQQFLAQVDAQLAWLADNTADAQQLMRALESSAWSCAQAAQSIPQAQAAGMSAEVQVRSPESFGASLTHLGSTPDAIGLMIGSFTTDQQQNLTCTLAIRADATYEVLGWRQTKLWSDIPQEETLLSTKDE